MLLGDKSYEGKNNGTGFSMWATVGAEGPPQRGGDFTLAPGDARIVGVGTQPPRGAAEGRPSFGCFSSGDSF